MAIIPEVKSSGGVFGETIGDDLAPEGTFKAKLIDIHNEFGVTRTKYQSDETEVVDLTTFLFGFRDQGGNPHMIATHSMKISGHPKSKLISVIKSMTGKQPKIGWDYCELKGQVDCLITIEHNLSRDGDRTYANIISFSPMPVEGVAPAPVVAPPPVTAAVSDHLPF